MRDRSELTLRNQKDFSRVYNKGKSRGSRFVVVLYNKNRLGYSRTAFVASKKVGNSVERNRARRLMKESYRSFYKDLSQGFDIIFVARAGISSHKEYEIEKCMRKALKDCGLLDTTL